MELVLQQVYSVLLSQLHPLKWHASLVSHLSFRQCSVCVSISSASRWSCHDWRFGFELCLIWNRILCSSRINS